MTATAAAAMVAAAAEGRGVKKMLKSHFGCGGDGGGWEGGGEEAISPFVDASGKQILVLLSKLDERFGVSHMRHFFNYWFKESLTCGLNNFH